MFVSSTLKPPPPRRRLPHSRTRLSRAIMEISRFFSLWEPRAGPPHCQQLGLKKPGFMLISRGAKYVICDKFHGNVLRFSRINCRFRPLLSCPMQHCGSIPSLSRNTSALAQQQPGNFFVPIHSHPMQRHPSVLILGCHISSPF